MMHQLRNLNPVFLVLFLPFVFNPFSGANPSEIPKYSFFLVVLVFLGGYLLVKSYKSKSWDLKVSKMVLLLGSVWLASVGISTIFSISPVESFFGQYFYLRGFIEIFLYFIFFLFVISILRDKKDQKLVVLGIEVVGLMCAIYGIIQLFFMDFEFMFGPGQLFAGRIYAFFSNPNDFGQFLIFPFFAALMGLFNLRGVSTKNKWMSIFHISSLIIIATALFLTSNRASMLAVIIGSFIFFLLNAKNVRHKLFVGGAAIVSLCVMIFLVLINLRSILSRFALWLDTLYLIPNSPFIGFGPETYANAIQQTLSTNSYEYEQLLALPNHPHNETLAIVTGQGVLGLAIFIFALIFLLWVVLKNYKKLLNNRVNIYAVLTVVATIITAQFSYLQTTHFVFLIVSVSILYNNLVLKDLMIRVENFKFVATPITVMLIFVCLFSATKLTLTDHYLGMAMGKSFDNQLEANHLFGLVINDNYYFTYPYDAVFTLMGEDLFMQEKKIPMFEQYLDRYGSISNMSYQYYSYKGLINYAKKDFEAARVDFGTAFNMAPNSARVCADQMSAAYLAGDKEMAMQAAQHCHEMLPSYIRHRDPNVDQHKLDIWFKSNPVYFQIVSLL